MNKIYFSGDLSVIDSLRKPFAHLTVKAFISAFRKSFADLFHESVVEIKIVKNTKAHSKKLACFKEMTYVSSCISLADRAVT